MTIPCVSDKVRKAMADNEAARTAVMSTIEIVPEGDYRRGVLFYALKVLNDCNDDYRRVLAALEGSQ